MRLKIDDLAQIKSADICMDGITVIAGQNNTGKSTIGKTLFAAFNSLYNIDEKVKAQRSQAIGQVLNRIFRNNSYIREYIEPVKNVNIVRNRIVSNITSELIELSDTADKDSVVAVITENLAMHMISFEKLDGQQDLFDDISEKIIAIINTSDGEVIKEVIGRMFSRVFNSQINHSNNPSKAAEVSLTVKKQDISIELKNNQCESWNASFNIMHEAFYIDDPFALDLLDDVGYSHREMSEMQRHLISRLATEYEDVMEGIFEAVVAKGKLKEIYTLLEKTISGNLVVHNGEVKFLDANHQNPIVLKNLSTGLKSFILVKMLLERGLLKERDVLILDEPEVHLHPEWQLVYAEIVVLLQKQFELSIVVTTHSVEFLEAIEYFSKKYGIEESCNYYLASVMDGRSSFENVTKDLDKIYKQMVSPSILLDKLRYEMEIGEDE